MLKKITASIFAVLLFLTAAAVGTPGKTDPKKQAPAMVKRLVANLSAREFTTITGKKLNFITRFGYNKLRKKYRRELEAAGLQNDYDTLYLANGTAVSGIIVGNTPAGIQYKTSSGDDSELKQVALKDVVKVQPARSLAAARDGEEVPIEKMATASMWLAIGGFIVAFIPFVSVISFFAIVTSLVLGIVALNKIKKSNGKLRGEGRAITGIVISGVFLLLLIVAISIIAAWGGWG